MSKKEDSGTDASPGVSPDKEHEKPRVVPKAVKKSSELKYRWVQPGNVTLLVSRGWKVTDPIPESQASSRMAREAGAKLVLMERND